MSKKDKIVKRDIPETESNLANWTNQKFKEAMLAKEDYTGRWLKYLNSWDNTLYENVKKPSYKTNHISNFIYSSIESMRPILFDNNPRFEAVPANTDAMQYSQDINTILDWEWDRSNMQEKLLANSIYTFALGTSIIMLPYSYDDGKDGNVMPTPVSPFNIYPDPLATSVEDAEYIIYADYVHVNVLKKKYPKKSKQLNGSDVKYSELVNDRDKGAKIDNQVLVLEVWCRDYTTIDVEEENVNGEIVSTEKYKYPNGRVIITCPELDIVLENKRNPYNSGRFPFFLFKDIDVPFQFWGEGECKWLLSPQQQINDLYNQIIDNAKTTANAQWIIDKNAGIPKGELTNRPGLIIRKNPGTTVQRDTPPSIPMYIQEMVQILKTDIEVISGVHDVTRGETPSGIQSAAAIQALQEAAQTRIRLKVALHENALGILGTEWINRIKQFWKFNRLIPRKKESTNTSTMELSGVEMHHSVMSDEEKYEYDVLEVFPEKQLQYEYKIKIIGSSTMQQSRASLLDQMIRLLQTTAEDGLPVVPREAVLDYLPNLNKRVVLEYFDKLKREQAAMQQQAMANNQIVEQMQMMMQQMQMLMQNVQSIQSRLDQQDEQVKQDEIRFQGYQQGFNESKALTNQVNKTGAIPDELKQQISGMNDKEFAELLANNPDLADYLDDSVYSNNEAQALTNVSGVSDISYNPDPNENFVDNPPIEKPVI